MSDRLRQRFAWAPGTTVIDTAWTATVNLPLRRGVMLVVDFRDPTGSIQAVRQANPAFAAVPAPPVAVTVSDTSGATQLVPFTELSAATFRFALLVPPDAAFNFKVTSSLLRLADATGSPLPQNMFQTLLTSPSAYAPAPAPALPLGRFTGSRIPARVYEFVVIGLVSP